MKYKKLALYGFVLLILGLFSYLFGVLIAVPRRLFFPDSLSLFHFNEGIVWYSGLPVFLGIIFILIDLFILFPEKRMHDHVIYNPVKSPAITVVLTAYNDDKSIADSVKDFKLHPFVKRVIVISNNSTDNTFQEAEKAGAIVFNENIQGYGSCVHRALSEAIKFKDTELTVLCEGDMTFRSYDIDKFIAYIAHADVVNGSRIVEPLLNKNTQLNIFMFYGNLFVAKLLELKHLGNATFTDVGTTYKICRNSALIKLMPKLNKSINLEFNPYFLDQALLSGFKIIECPITFHKRQGESKGASNNSNAIRIGIRMIRGILIGWAI